MYTEDTGFSKVEEAFGEQQLYPSFVNRGNGHCRNAKLEYMRCGGLKYRHLEKYEHR